LVVRLLALLLEMLERLDFARLQKGTLFGIAVLN
jgi:hypothetical protein